MIKGNDLGLAFIAALGAWGDKLDATLDDATKACAAAKAKGTR